jgi:hypothetical protein
MSKSPEGIKPAVLGAFQLCGSKPQTIRWSDPAARPADWEIGETAGWETCGTVAEPASPWRRLAPSGLQFTPVWGKRPLLSNGKRWCLKKFFPLTAFGPRFALKDLYLQGVRPGRPYGESGWKRPGFWNFPLLSNGKTRRWALGFGLWANGTRLRRNLRCQSYLRF